VGSGSQQRRPEVGRLIMLAMKAGWHVVDEGRIKPRGIRKYVDLALNAGWFLGRVLLIGLGLEPYWGKPDVWNLREGAGTWTTEKLGNSCTSERVWIGNSPPTVARACALLDHKSIISSSCFVSFREFPNRFYHIEQF